MYICPTPLGNLEDITLRVLRVLKEADYVAAEDTRRTRKLLSYYDIHTPVLSFHQHSSQNRVQKLVAMISAGKNMALVSDAGTPGISDPGQALVAACIAEGIEVDPLPGPCAAIVALSASGYPLASFTFQGFLPRKDLDKAVASLAAIEHPVVVYESPRRIVKLLRSINEYMPQREMVMGRELTKKHQQILRGTARELLPALEEGDLERGEFTVVLGPWRSEEPSWSPSEVLDRVRAHVLAGASTRDAVALVSAEIKLPRRQIYAIVNKSKQDL